MTTPQADQEQNDCGNAGTQLCTRCGLCCMGVIHRVAVLDDSEIALANEKGLEVLTSPRPLFSLPCPRLEGTICGIYRDRPNVCSRYKCQLLQDVEAGVRSLEDGAEKVAEAKRMLIQVRSASKENLDYGQTRRLALWPGSDCNNDAARTQQGQKAVQLKLAVLAFDLFIDKFFRNSRDRKILELSALEMGAESNS